MKRYRTLLFSFAVLAGLLVVSSAFAETLYVVVLFNRTAVVGASSMKSGLYFSTNGGDNWQHTGWENIRAFGMDADGGNRYLAAGNGVLRSLDSGATWKIVTDQHVAEALRVAADVDHTTIFTATAHGVWRSSDRGETWSQRNDGLRSTFTSSMLLDPTTRTVLTGTEEALYMSTDHGEHWNRSEDSVVCGTGILDLKQSPANSHMIFAATENRGVLHSHDGGLHWTFASNGLLRTAYYALAMDPHKANTAFVAGLNSGMWKTTDAGASWHEVGADSLAGKSFHALAISEASPNVIFAGEYNGGVWRSNDGGETWNKIGLDGSQIWEMVVK